MLNEREGRLKEKEERREGNGRLEDEEEVTRE